MTRQSKTRKQRKQPPKVALLFEIPNAYARGLLVGIGEYILAHGPWRVYYAARGHNERAPNWLQSWDGQGIIARGENHLFANAIDRLDIPIVDLTPSRLIPRSPWIKSDDAAVAKLAAQHFFERGFKHFGFCGDSRFKVAKRRSEYFSILIQRSHLPYYLYEPKRPPLNADAETDAIGKWLSKLPKPVGVFAYNDERGQQVLDGCRRANLAVPEEVAVLGVDNDEVLCALSPPPLSSIQLNPHRTGWEAAALLDLMMKGKKVSPAHHLVPPLGVVTRQSTDVLAVHDPQIAQALRFIREHACDGISVKDVLQHCPMARRSMETRFKQLLGRTPRLEIIRVQLNRVKELLVGTKLTIGEISERTGFEPDYLSVVFRQNVGSTPSEFRRKYGISEGDGFSI